MGNAIVIGILLIIVWRALVSAPKHFKGQGGCCGGGDDVIRERKRLQGKKIGEWTVQIEGMHCENCRNRVEQAINKLEGVVCRVNLRKKLATIEYSESVEETAIRSAIEALGYEIKNMTNI